MRKFVMLALIHLVKVGFPRYWSVSTKLIWSQSVLETGNFDSMAYNDMNNLFGMHVPTTRPNLVSYGKHIPNEGYVAGYKTKLHSVIDYFLRQKYFNIKAETYFEQTVKGPRLDGRYKYATDPVYAESWTRVYEVQGKNQINLSWLYLSLLLLVLAWRLLKKYR